MPGPAPDLPLRVIEAPHATATIRLGEAIGARLAMGDVVHLIGDLGAGKTTLARGIVRAWTAGAVDEVPSPTYTLAQTYEGPAGVLTHMDLYRLRRPEEAFELGIEEAPAEGAVLIEWPERLAGEGPRASLVVRIAPAGAGRRIEVSGPAWVAELAA